MRALAKPGGRAAAAPLGGGGYAGVVLAHGGYAPVPAKPVLRRDTAEEMSSGSSGSSRGGGGSTGGSGFPCREKGKCRYEVRSTPVRVMPVAGHLFLVFSDPCGNQIFWRGGPEEPPSGESRCSGLDGDYGAVETETGIYGPGSTDWDPDAATVTVQNDEPACAKAKIRCLDAESARITASCTGYAKFGPNSNSVAYTILGACGLAKEKPGGWHPGWEESIP